MKAISSKKLLGVLEKIGLDPNEANVYLSCLKLGTQSVEAIAKDVGFPSRDTVAVLRKLHERGFVSKLSTGKDFFTAEPPDVVAGILESEAYNWQLGFEQFRASLALFSEFANPAFTRPEIAFYRGEEGIVAAYEDTLTSKTDILAVTSIDDTESTLPAYVPRYYLRRKAAGISIRAIFPDTPMSRSRQKKDKQELRESRLVPRKFLSDFRLEYYIYDDKVAYFSVVENIAVIVKSSFIAEGMRCIFAMLWDMAGQTTSEKNQALRRRATR